MSVCRRCIRYTTVLGVLQKNRCSHAPLLTLAQKFSCLSSVRGEGVCVSVAVNPKKEVRRYKRWPSNEGERFRR
jgi:4-aminobutyrate aminotransferase-like enzyme